MADEAVYSRSSVQVNLPEPLRSELVAWTRKHVPDDALAAKGNGESGESGRESIPHCTVLYGIHSASPGPVSDVVQRFGEGSGDGLTVTLGTTDLFTGGDEHDVLIVQVQGEQLHQLHEALKKDVPNDWAWPAYRPHVTLAYVRKGAADSLKGRHDFDGRRVSFDGVLFSSKDGRKVTLHLGAANRHAAPHFHRAFAEELAKQAGLTTTIKHLLGLPTPARSALRSDPLTDPDLAKELSRTFSSTPGATRDGRGVVRIGGRRGRRRSLSASAGTANMLVGRPGSRFYRGDLAKASVALGFPFSTWAIREP